MCLTPEETAEDEWVPVDDSFTTGVILLDRLRLAFLSAGCSLMSAILVCLTTEETDALVNKAIDGLEATELFLLDRLRTDFLSAGCLLMSATLNKLGSVFTSLS